MTAETKTAQDRRGIVRGAATRAYPYALAVVFPLDMWLRNVTDEPAAADVLATFGVALAVAWACDLVARRITRDAHLASLDAAVAVAATLSYGHVRGLAPPPGIPHRILLPAWIAAAGAAFALAWRARHSPVVPHAARGAAYGTAVLLAFQAVNGLHSLAMIDTAGRGSGDTWRAAAPGLLAELDARAKRPDIYYIILDGYARADVLNQLFGFDNAEFIDTLRGRGFYVADRAQANYAQTRLALAAALSMDYLPRFREGDDYDAHHEQLKSLRQGGRAIEFLREYGYRYRYVGSVHYRTDPAADENYFWGGNDGHYVLTYLGTTLLDLARHTLDRLDFFSHPADVLDFQLEHVARRKRSDEPLVTVAHLCCPHFPYVFDRHGRRERVIQEEEGTHNDYVEQIRYLNPRVLELIEQIDRTSGKDAIIVFQADHGSSFLGMAEEPQPRQLFERMSILSAFRAPPAVRERLYDEITPVNTFRAVLAGLFDEAMPLVADRSLYSTYEAPFRYCEAPGDELRIADRGGSSREVSGR